MRVFIPCVICSKLFIYLFFIIISFYSLFFNHYFPWRNVDTTPSVSRGQQDCQRRKWGHSWASRASWFWEWTCLRNSSLLVNTFSFTSKLIITLPIRSIGSLPTSSRLKLIWYNYYCYCFWFFFFFFWLTFAVTGNHDDHFREKGIAIKLKKGKHKI